MFLHYLIPKKKKNPTAQPLTVFQLASLSLNKVLFMQSGNESFPFLKKFF